jgi:probable HAF family extracellular repeat protein
MKGRMTMWTLINAPARRRALTMAVLAMAIVAIQLVVRPAARASALVASPTYTVEDLGVFPDGGGASLATGINSAGDVSGYANHSTAGYTAFRWSNGALTDLGDFGCGAHGNAINDTGTVVGYSNVSCAESYKAGFQAPQNTLLDIGTLANGSQPVIAYGINASGQIVGSSVTEHGTTRAFVSGPGGAGLQQIDNLATEPPGAQALEGHGVNSAGDVAGFAFFFDQTCGGHDAPFLFSGGTIQELVGLDCSGVGTAINDSGVVVGSKGTHAFKWDGTIHDLGLPDGAGAFSQALAINTGGTVVGAAYACQLCPPQAWINGTTLLNNLIDPALGWNLQVAAGINDSGQIAGYGGHNGLVHAFRLTPVVAKTLTSIAVTPATPTIPKGASEQFTATGTYSDGSSADLTGSVSWLSSKTNVATISSSGLLSTLRQGTVSVTAVEGSVSGSTSATVGSPKLVSIVISPLNVNVSVGAVQQYTATGTYSDGRTTDLTTKGSWVSSNKKVATIGLHTGSAMALKSGATTIKLSSGGLTASTSLTVGPVGIA